MAWDGSRDGPKGLRMLEPAFIGDRQMCTPKELVPDVLPPGDNLGVDLGMFWGCSGDVLGVFQGCSGSVLGCSEGVLGVI